MYDYTLISEVLRRDWERNPDEWDLAKHPMESWCVPSFMEHPVTRKYGPGLSKPLGFYSDKVALHAHDGFYRGSVCLTISKKRLTCFVVLTSMLCKCGCNGHCTVDALLFLMNWSLNLCQDGVEPLCRDDLMPWILPQDRKRQERAGKELPFGKGAVTEYRHACW